MWGLQNMLMVHNPFIDSYRHAYQILQAHRDDINYQVTLWLTPGTNRGVYNLPTVNEVAFILPGTIETESRDIVLRLPAGAWNEFSTSTLRMRLFSTHSFSLMAPTSGILSYGLSRLKIGDNRGLKTGDATLLRGRMLDWRMKGRSTFSAVALFSPDMWSTRTPVPINNG